MSTIRKQSIIASVIVYIGFALGFFNTYLFTRQGGLTAEQFGLTNTFIAIASIMFSVAGLGMPMYIGKFFPYYKAHLPNEKNDQLTWALLITGIGFFIVLILGISFKHILIDRIFDNSPELPKYYYWTFLFGFGYTFYMIMDAYALQHRKAVLSSFLKEVLFRVFITVLILLTSYQIIKSFDVFIGIYSISYIILVILMLMLLWRENKLHFSFNVSNVTRRFYRKIITLSSFVWGGSLVFNIASVFDGIVIAAVLPNGMASAGIYYLAQNISSLMQAPQRAIVAASIGPLSQAWKEKNLGRISRIYHRSSINQLIFSCAMFCLIWLNFEDGIHTFHLQERYLAAKWIFLFIGLAKIVDMGTGLNSQIIGTSTYWRFDFISGVVLLALTLPMNYFLTRIYGPVGPAISNLISFTIYNAIRYTFLLRKYNMQPFDRKTIYTLLLAAAVYYLCYYLFDDFSGILWIIIRSSIFSALFIAGCFLLNLSPDILPVWETMKKRLGLSRS
jgi:O-antigen/teichoic acid export membrane protein